MRLYGQVSLSVRGIFERFTDLIEPISIDEAFLDVTGSGRLHGSGPTIASRIKRAIREEERLTASIGCATSKFVAKVASDLDKPDGLVVVSPGTEAEFLEPLPIDRLWGAGPRAVERFRRIGCATIGDAARLDRAALVRAFGEAGGDRFHSLCRGVDDRPVVASHVRKSLGKETTFAEDVADRRVVERTLLDLSERVAASLRRRGLAGATIAVKVRWEGFDTVTRRRTLKEPVDTVEKIWPVARELLRAADRPRRRVRLVGVTLSALDRSASGQEDLFLETRTADSRVAEAVDALAERFGAGAVTRAALLDSERSTEVGGSGVRVTRLPPESDAPTNTD